MQGRHHGSPWTALTNPTFPQCSLEVVPPYTSIYRNVPLDSHASVTETGRGHMHTPLTYWLVISETCGHALLACALPGKTTRYLRGSNLILWSRETFVCSPVILSRLWPPLISWHLWNGTARLTLSPKSPLNKVSPYWSHFHPAFTGFLWPNTQSLSFRVKHKIFFYWSQGPFSVWAGLTWTSRVFFSWQVPEGRYGGWEKEDREVEVSHLILLHSKGKR